jgi:hypothetical protein
MRHCHPALRAIARVYGRMRSVDGVCTARALSVGSQWR